MEIPRRTADGGGVSEPVPMKRELKPTIGQSVKGSLYGLRTCPDEEGIETTTMPGPPTSRLPILAREKRTGVYTTECRANRNWFCMCGLSRFVNHSPKSQA